MSKRSSDRLVQKWCWFGRRDDEPLMVSVCTFVGAEIDSCIGNKGPEKVMTKNNGIGEELVAMGAAQSWGVEFHGHVVYYREILVKTFLGSQELDVGEVCQRV